MEWKFGGADNAAMVRIKPRLTVTSDDAALDAVRAGLGICRLLCYQIAAELAEGRLAIILAEYEEAPWPVHILHRETNFGSSKVRNFIDLLAASLRAEPSMNHAAIRTLPRSWPALLPLSAWRLLASAWLSTLSRRRR